MRVAGDKEGKGGKGHGIGNKVACNEEGDGKGGRQATATRAMATMWAMATVLRLVGDKEDKGKGGKGNGNGNVRVAGKEEDGGQVDCNGNKEGNGNGNKGGGRATVTATKRVMATAPRVVGNKEGNGNGRKSDGNSSEGGG
jgi:hypothetical protein